MLGPLELEADGASLALGGLRQRAVLASLLAERNHVLSADRLIDMVWEGDPPASAAATLQTYVSHLRRVLSAAGRDGAAVIETRPPGYVLHTAPDEVDADVAERTVDEASAALDRGDPRSAADLVDRVLRRVPADVPLARLPALEVLTGTALALGDVDRAGGASAELTAIAELVGTPSIQAAVDHSAAQVAAATGEHDVARVRFEDAVDAYHRSGCRFEAERSRLALAETLAALGRDADAAREADLARARLAELGAATSHGGGSRGVITPREREVLGLVAEGLTNPQIAERLVISEHTVHRHVANLLGKLGVPSRAAAAAKAVQVGLLDHE